MIQSNQLNTLMSIIYLQIYITLQQSVSCNEEVEEWFPIFLNAGYEGDFSCSCWYDTHIANN